MRFGFSALKEVPFTDGSAWRCRLQQRRCAIESPRQARAFNSTREAVQRSRGRRFTRSGEFSLTQVGEIASTLGPSRRADEAFDGLRKRRANARMQVDELHLAMRSSLLEYLLQVAAHRVLGHIQ